MALHHNPRIVTQGLVLHLDAADKNSYPGTGTAWNDLSGLGNNGTLVNEPVFSTTNNGNFIFDGSNDYVNFYAPNLTTTATVEMWCKIGAGYINKMFMGWLYYDVYCVGGNLGFNTGNGDAYGISSSTVTTLGLVNNWVHYIFEMRSDVSYTNNKIYINGASQILSQRLGSEAPSNRSFNNGNGRIATWIGSASYYMPMNCASFKIYNRALSAQEILQNYNATKSRFGL
jgi:hypothetical protein